MTPLKRLFHWGPLASMAITASITISTLSTPTGPIWIFLFQLTMCMTLYNMWCATLIGPGYLSNISTDEQKQQTREQQKDQASKSVVQPESGRFCRRCCNVVLKKHHHCPWINNCVGQYNEQYFIRFLLFAIAVTIQSSTHLLIHTCLNKIILIFNIFNIGLSIGVFIAVSVLLFTH